MDYFFVYDSSATYEEVWQYLANLGLKKFFGGRRRNPDDPDEDLVYEDDTGDEDPRVMKKLLAIMLRQARALGWEIPPTWDPFDPNNNIPQILLDMTSQDMKTLLQNQVKLLVNIVKEHKLYGVCERLEGAKWEEDPNIIIPMKIMEQPDGALYWGIPTLYLWIPPRGEKKGFKKYFVYDRASGKRVFIKTKKGKPACHPRTKKWHHPREDLQSFITTDHHWPVPFLPRRWKETKPDKWLAALVGKRVEICLDCGKELEFCLCDATQRDVRVEEIVGAFNIPGEPGRSHRQVGGAYLQFSDPDPKTETLLSGVPISIIAEEVPPTSSEINQTTSLSPDILPHPLPDGHSPPEELALTDNGNAFQWQELAVERWWNADGNGLVEACTGAGKTKFCLSAIERVMRELADLGMTARISIVVPTKSLLSQWYEEVLERFNDKVEGISRHGSGFSDPAGQLSLWIINTAAKEFPVMSSQHPHLDKYTYHFLIVDEVHRSTSRTFRKIYEDEAEFKLGVTATLPGKDQLPNSPGVRKFKLLQSKIGPVICQYKYPHALMKGNISKFKLIYRETDFTEGEKTAYDALTEKINQLSPAVANKRKAGKLFPEGYDAESYSKLTDAQKEDVGDPVLLRILKFLGASRSRIDWCAAKRMACAADLIREKLAEGKKIIVFHKSIHGAMALYNLLTLGYGYQDPETPGYSHPTTYQDEIGIYHSGNKAHVNENFLEAFRKEPTDEGHKIRCLLSVESLLEGLDVPSADVGISVAATKSEIKAIQSLGRVLRVKRDASGQPIEEDKEYYFITIRDSLGDAQVKIKFENSLVDADGEFIMGAPLIEECPYHEPEEIDYIHHRSGLFNYMQLYKLASDVLGDHDLLTRSQLVKAIMKEETKRKKSREEAVEAGEDYDESLIEGVEWYKPPEVHIQDWAEVKPQYKRKNHRLRKVRRNPYFHDFHGFHDGGYSY
jgi:superfamily II DNA or RNA helicase